MIKIVSIAILVAIIAVGGVLAIGTFTQTPSVGVQAMAPTAEEIARDYADIKAVLDRNIHDSIEVLNKPENKALSTEINTSVDKLRRLASDYTAKKQAGASAADLQAIATDYATTVRSTLTAARALVAAIGKYRDGIRPNMMLLKILDADRANADEPGIIDAAKPTQEGLIPLSAASRQIAPVLTKVRAALSEKEQSGAEISDDEEAAEYLKAATAVLEAGATAVAN